MFTIKSSAELQRAFAGYKSMRQIQTLIPITILDLTLMTPHTHKKKPINHVYDKTDKHAHVKLGFPVNAKMTPIWVASEYKRLNQSSLILRSCWHTVHQMITSV